MVSIKKAYPGHAKRVMMGVWSYLRQFMYTKWVIVVDDDIDARDWKDVMWAISTRMDPARDITVVENTPIDYLDFASPESGLGSQDRPRRHQQVAAGNQTRLGPPDRDGPRGGGDRHGEVGQTRAALENFGRSRWPKLEALAWPSHNARHGRKSLG